MGVTIAPPPKKKQSSPKRYKIHLSGFYQLLLSLSFCTCLPSPQNSLVLLCIHENGVLCYLNGQWHSSMWSSDHRIALSMTKIDYKAWKFCKTLCKAASALCVFWSYIRYNKLSHDTFILGFMGEKKQLSLNNWR